MQTLWSEIRYCTRVLAKSPSFTAVCVLTLALGIGANTAVFSIVNSLLFRPLPVKDPQQLAVLTFRQKHGPVNSNFSFPELRDLRGSTRQAFSDVFGYQLGLDGLSVNGKADRLVTAFVTGNFFSALGLQPVLGRFMRSEEGEAAGTEPGIVLGYRCWKSRFQGAPNVIGKKVLLDGRPTSVIGVAPESFHGLFSSAETEAYIPLAMAAAEGLPADFLENRSVRNLKVFGRLHPEQNLSQARAVLEVEAARMAQNHPESEKDFTLQALPELRSRPEPDSDNTVLVISLLFMGLSAMVLLLACVNVANILLVRATIRHREMAIRVALGAARKALLRQLLTESLLLGICGGAAGILLGYLASSSLASLPLGTDLPIRLDFGFDWRVFAYASSGALLAGIVVGLLPSLRASRADVNQILHQGGRGSVGGRHRLRNALVSVQVAASLTLLIVAGLFTRSLQRAESFDLGFNPSHVANFDLDPSEIGYSEAQGQTLFRQVLERVRSLPGVQSASLAANVPMGYVNASDYIAVPGKEAKPVVAYNVVTPDYFDTMMIKVQRGRTFTPDDKTAAARFTAVISQAMAKEFWPKQDPIGHEFTIGSDPAHPLHVIGVVNDTRERPTGTMRSFFYLPLAQHYTDNSFETLQVRTAGDPRSIMIEVQRTIHGLAPDLPVFDVITMQEALYTLNGLLIFQLGAGLAAALGLLGLLLAVVGVYGVISYTATQQTHEIGLRMALGAKPANILGMVFSRGMLIIGIGIAIGLVATAAAAGLVQNFLLISPTDPLTYSVVTALLSGVALLACYVPSRRAMKVDPMEALRED